jgi:hypothetical protein
MKKNARIRQTTEASKNKKATPDRLCSPQTLEQYMTPPHGDRLEGRFHGMILCKSFITV